MILIYESMQNQTKIGDMSPPIGETWCYCGSMAVLQSGNASDASVVFVEEGIQAMLSHAVACDSESLSPVMTCRHQSSGSAANSPS